MSNTENVDQKHAPGCFNCPFREKLYDVVQGEKVEIQDQNPETTIHCLRFPPTMLPIPKFNVVTGKPDVQWVRVFSTNPRNFICGEHPSFHLPLMRVPPEAWPDLEKIKPGDIIRVKELPK